MPCGRAVYGQTRGFQQSGGPAKRPSVTGASAETNQGILGHTTQGWFFWEDLDPHWLLCTLQRGSVTLTESRSSLYTTPVLYYSPSGFTTEYRNDEGAGCGVGRAP